MENVLRVAKYRRVSTDEQALHGYSLQTQADTLDEYCKTKGYKIVGDYVDEGISGAKPPLKRPALKQLLDDVKAGKIDIIVFTKLDRWFRSIEQYYKVQEILERHNVVWQAVLEDYNTATADGRLKVNIMLSVAANERERTSERIKVVLDHKRKNKVAAFGGSKTTLGYIKQKDENGLTRLIKDPETQHIIEEFWDMLIKYNNVMKAGMYLNTKYNLSYPYHAWDRVRRNELYSGEFRGIKDFCEPYISRDAWLKVMEVKNIKKTPKNNIYLFTGLIKCPYCGRILCSNYSRNSYGKVYKTYKCSMRASKLCDFKGSITEITIERWLLNNLEQLINLEIERVESERAEQKKQPKTDVAKLKEKQRKLNVIYMNGTINDEEYILQANELKALIAKAEQESPQVQKDISYLKDILKSDWKALYAVMTEENKRRFWRSMIKEIILEGKTIKGVIFFREKV